MPITSNTTQLYPLQAYVTVQGAQRKALADQVTTVSKLRLRGRIGLLTGQS